MLIAQLSDCHITASGMAYGQAHTTQALDNAVTYLNTLVPSPDMVLLTGDIADHGQPGEYAVAASLLDRLKAPFLLVPGNHDQREPLREAFPGHSYLHKSPIGTPVRYVEESLPVKLVGLDTSRPGCHGGGLASDDLDWLEQHLSDGRPSLVFMHHPPFKVGIGNMDEDGFEGAEALESVLKRSENVVRLCCGHMHRAVLRTFGGRAACIAPSTGMQLVLDLTEDAPSQFLSEPGGLALHYLPPSAKDMSSLVTHFGLVPGCGHSFPGPYPFDV